MNLIKKRRTNGVTAEEASPLASLQNEIQRVFENAWDAFAGGAFPNVITSTTTAWPAIDVAEDDAKITVRADVPGLEIKDVSVEVSGSVLTISGSRTEEHKEEKKGYFRQERSSGSFSRAITLPPYADAANVAASYDKGVLTVTIPKVPGQEPKRVEVKTA